MNHALLQPDVQKWLWDHADADVHRIALSSSPFQQISAAELATQLTARRNSRKKLPTWYATPGIIFPTLLSIEQASSETTARYKAGLVTGKSVADLTGGFGVDSLYFSRRAQRVLHCEMNSPLAEVAAHNARLLGSENIRFAHADGLDLLAAEKLSFDTIYLDPVRRGLTGKVFLFADCQPNVIEHLDFLMAHCRRLIIKSSPLIDLTAGIRELGGVTEIHIVSVRNECRELLWVIDENRSATPEIIAASLNSSDKCYRVRPGAEMVEPEYAAMGHDGFLFEPDAAVMKSGAFNQVAQDFGLKKIAPQSHLYTGSQHVPEFPGRVFTIREVTDWPIFKKQKGTAGNVIVRNFPLKAAELSKKYNRGAADTDFLIFTTNLTGKQIVISAEILQYY
ncbi:class I SAM-dependent methyltransferase [Pedobacter sp. SYP-B3415]|uniref:THUMP-like domain-containing protein n=1 Tax=Pedobacter sp. SYP-B3415 TaxID=2496641 RepID=UPI00101D523A|nr:class I SAM-dependent methyltransferase [Pedobacter sp. SYP-B3415]